MGFHNVFILSVIPNGIKGIENIPQASARFFNIIETLIGSNLTTLSILNHHDVSLLRIATACPLLQHLYVGLDPEPESPTEEDGYHVDNNATPLLIHLVYLVLDFKFQFSSRVFPLLQQAPNLRILHFISSSPSDFIPQVMENNNIDFIQIMVTCPKIYHLECHFDDLDYLNLVQDHQTICNNDRYDGLRRLIYNDDDYVTSPRSGRVLQLLHHVYSTLTVLKIKQFWCPRYQNSMSTPAWADLVSVSLPALQDFSTEYLNKPDMDAVCIFLKQYQHNVTSSLKSVALHVWSSSFNDHLFSALFHIYSLISVKFDVNDVFDRVEVDTWASVPNNVGSFRYLSRNLRTIQIYGDIRFSGGDSELRDQYTRRLTHTDYTNELSITYTKIS